MASDIAPLLQALFWSFAIICGVWIVVQAIEVVATWPAAAPEPAEPDRPEPAESRAH
jgi:hypothetical protein